MALFPDPRQWPLPQARRSTYRVVGAITLPAVPLIFFLASFGLTTDPVIPPGCPTTTAGEWTVLDTLAVATVSYAGAWLGDLLWLLRHGSDRS